MVDNKPAHVSKADKGICCETWKPTSFILSPAVFAGQKPGRTRLDSMISLQRSPEKNPIVLPEAIPQICSLNVYLLLRRLIDRLDLNGGKIATMPGVCSTCQSALPRGPERMVAISPWPAWRVLQRAQREQTKSRS